MSRRGGKTSNDEKLIRLFKIRTGNHDPSMPEVAAWAEANNIVRMPKPKTAVELLAKRLSRSARMSTRQDEETGLFYRSNLAYPVIENGEAKVRWFDPEGPTATRDKFAKARTLRREQMVGDAFQYAVDDRQWNRNHPNEEQFVLDLDFSDDVLWRMNGAAAQRKAS